MRCWPCILVLLACAALVPAPGQAGLRITAVNVLQDPIASDTEVTPIFVLGEADCTSVLLRRPPTSTGAIPMLASWTGDNLLITGPPEILIDPSGCGPTVTTIPINATLSVAILGLVPAMEPQHGTVRWRFENSPADEQDPAQADGAFSVRPLPRVSPQATFGALQALVDKAPVSFSVQVANRGNVAFDATGAGALKDVRGDPQVTATVSVSSTQVARNGTGELLVTVAVPIGGKWTAAHVVGNLTFTSAVEPFGEPRRIPFDFLLTSKDAGRKESPAPGAVVLVLFLVAFVGRRRGQGST